MDGNSYVDIFATKGLEYLMTILYICLIIPFWILLNKKSRKYVVDKIRTLTLNILKIPKGIFFSKNYTWSFLQKDGNAKVGINDLLQHFIGKVKINNLKKEGDIIKKGQVITLINKDNDKLLKIYSPISGRIIKNNYRLEENSELLNNPYDDGWFYIIEPDNWIKDTNNYLLSENAINWFSNQITYFKDFLSKNLSMDNNMALQDGGELIDNTLSELPSDVWNNFQKEFLDN